ncbi:MAG: hypothetical protein AB2746_07455, partial [Candidatus Thiodiazotropha taylori]
MLSKNFPSVDGYLDLTTDTSNRSASMIWHGIAHSPELQSDFYIGTLLLINMKSQAYQLVLDFV